MSVFVAPLRKLVNKVSLNPYSACLRRHEELSPKELFYVHKVLKLFFITCFEIEFDNLKKMSTDNRVVIFSRL